MSLSSKNNTFWICRLKPQNIAAWSNGLLDEKAKVLGINGWMIPFTVDCDGNLITTMWNHQDCCLPTAPWINIQHPLSPSQEIKLTSQLEKWWSNKKTLTIMGQKFFVLSGIQNLSHTGFAIKRMKLSFPKTLIVGKEDEWKSQRDQESIDCIIQSHLKGSQEKPVNYLQNLKKAHHGMNSDRRWIPSVSGLTAQQEPLWRNASAHHYVQWLLQASAWSRLRYLEYKEAPLLIDNWDSHQRWYDPNLESQSVTIRRQDQSEQDQAVIHAWGNRKKKNIAIMIHGFYLDKLNSILSSLPPGGNQHGIPSLDLYISTPHSQVEEAKRILMKQSWPRVYLCGVSNRGRDISPFLLNLLPEALRIGHQSFIKLHTKKSPHLKAGTDWSDHLINSLLSNKFLSTLNDDINQDPQLGLIAPSGTLFKSSVALSRNVDHLQTLLEKKQWDGAWALRQSYVAGSMMAGRLSAMRALEQLQLTLDDFEPEQGQTDGTLAHALERMISWAYANQGLTITTLPGESQSVPQFGFGWV